jgi:hypothetical protein
MKKTVSFTKGGISKLAQNRPVTYEIKTDGGRTNYVGVAKRNRVLERLEEHLPRGKDPAPGSKVTIQQHTGIDVAKRVEARKIVEKQPPHNKQGKYRIADTGQNVQQRYRQMYTPPRLVGLAGT